jgi:hypothetical protein
MRFSALILAGLLLSFNGQTQAQTHFLDNCGDTSDTTGGKVFAENACYTDFDPNNIMSNIGSTGYTSPKCDMTKSLSAAIKSNLEKAYNTAPLYVRQKLCQLTLHDCDSGKCYQLFVTSGSAIGTSWGFWEAKDWCPASGCTTPPGRVQPIGLGVFIGVSENLLNGTVNSIVDVENRLVSALTRANGNPSDLHFFKEPTGRPELAALGVLAHELGHVLLADSNADGFFDDHPRRKVAREPSNNCFDTRILQESWVSAEYKKPARAKNTRWITFKLTHADTLSKNRIKWPDVYNLVQNNKHRDARAKIAVFYDAKEFVSLWASLRPEEDFVETFKYKVLSDAMQSQPLMVNFGAGDINVLEFVRKGPPGTPDPVPYKKVQCLKDLGLVPP